MISFIDSYTFDKIIFNNKENENLSLLSPSNVHTIFKNIPRTFEIKTNNGSCYFNKFLIKDISTTISAHIESNPNSNKYHLSIDNNKILQKIEELCQGNLIKLNENELSEYQSIIKTLQIQQLEIYNFNRIIIDKGIIIRPKCYEFFYSKGINSMLFTIKINNQKYKCNKYGACSSKVIRDFIINNPDADSYSYKFDDKYESFSTICSFFNFRPIQMPSNLKYIKKIAEDLKIDIILDKINKICQEQNKIIEKIDGEQELIDLINELFEKLFKINELSVETVKQFIIESRWSKSEEDVQELAAFIIKVINANERLHFDLIELLIQLDSENSKELKILLPFVKEKIMKNFAINKLGEINTCSFIYKLYSKGIINREEICTELKRKNDFNSFTENAIKWFLPEMIEIGSFDINKIDDDSLKKENIQFFLPDKIDLYKKMRDSGKSNDEIAEVLKNDDVDTLQKHIAQSIILDKDLSNFVIKPTIFEPFREKNISYINYSAAYGSIKCFKYLMLNHFIIDKSTFIFSVYGDNIEIIKIVDNYFEENKIETNDKVDILIYLIRNHKNNLFDWYFEKTIKDSTINDFKLNNYRDRLSELIQCAVSNENVHALLTFIDKKYNIGENRISFMQIAASDGFYHFLKFLYNISNQNWKNYYNCSSFGNLSIFKFYLKTKTESFEIDSAIRNAIEYDQTKMINYFFETQSEKITNKTISAIFVKSLQRTSDELFYSFFDKLKQIVPLVFSKYVWSMSLLEVACKFDRIKPFYTIVKLIDNRKLADFTNCLYRAAKSGSKEICTYIINQKFNVSYDKIFQKISQNYGVSSEILLLLFNNSGLKSESSIFLPFLSNSIRNSNKNFVEFLIERNIYYDECLIDSIMYGSFYHNEIMKIILKHNSNSSFVNKVTSKGTALHVAVERCYLNDVKLLLSIPSINPFILNSKNETPLMVASKKLARYNETSFDILYELFIFCGKNIISSYSTIECLLDSSFTNYSRNTKAIKILETLLNFENIEYFFARNKNYYIKFINTKNIRLIQSFLKLNSSEINSILPNGDTPLIAALKTKDQDVINLFINDPKIYLTEPNKNGQNLFNFLSKTEILEIVKKILSNPSIDTLIIEDILNYSLTNDQNIEIIYNIIETASKFPNIVTQVFLNNYYFPYICCDANVDINLVKMFLKIENIDVNICSPSNGNNILISALINQRVDIAELLINDPRTDINITNFNHESALIIATLNQLTSIVKLLLNHEKFDADLSHAIDAFMIANDEISDILSSLNLININYLSFNSKSNDSWIDIPYSKEIRETPLIVAAENRNMKKIEQIIKHPRFDENKSNLLYTINIIIDTKQQEVINEFFKILINNKLINYCMNSCLFCNLLNEISIEILDELLTDLNISTLNILSLFDCSLNASDYSIRIMTALLNYDKKHQNLIDFKKNSHLTKIRNDDWIVHKNMMKNVENIVNFIFENGGDVNAADENGVYPFEHAIKTNFVELAITLIKTNKVNYNQTIYLKNNNVQDDKDENEHTNKIQSDTYIHLAAKQEKEIFKLILESNILDINSRNSQNETPLMVACKCLNADNIKLLFEKDKIDFHCKNDNNEDALEIAQKSSHITANINAFDNDHDSVDKKESNIMLTKEQYLEKILEIIDIYNIQKTVFRPSNNNNQKDDPTPYNGWELDPGWGWGSR